MHGRSGYPNQFKVCKPLFAAMSIELEKVSSRRFRTCSNMSSRVRYNDQYPPLNGKVLAEVITPQRVAMLMVIAENNMSINSAGKVEWKKEKVN